MAIQLPFDGQIGYAPDFLSPKESMKIFRQLQKEVDWQQYHVLLFGRRIPQPRLCAWYGRPEARYSYSGIKLEPQPFTAALEGVLQRIQEHTGTEFNSVLVNLYRNEKDSMGWHSDDERELGPNPIIASLSLGETRQMQFKHKTRREHKVKLHLGSGSLLLMQGNTQHHWLHAVPRNTKPCGPRINLTFRKIIGTGS